jgi:hypothetical protein
MRKLSAAIVVAATALATAPGCGGTKPTGRLSGTIKYEGQPVSVGSITVVSADAKENAVGRVNASGDYVVENAPAGKVKIAFNYHVVADPNAKISGQKDLSKMKDQMKDKGPSGSEPELTEAQRKAAKLLATLPEKYRSWQNSGLETEVIANQDNTYNIEMKAK